MHKVCKKAVFLWYGYLKQRKQNEAGKKKSKGSNVDAYGTDHVDGTEAEQH